MAFRIDLRRDFDELYAHLVECVRRFDPLSSRVLGEPGSVKMIEYGYEYSQSGWAVVVFDMRPDAEPDGEWTSCIEGNELEREHWLKAGEMHWKEPITLIHLDGREENILVNFEIAVPLGEMVKAVLLKAREDGLFASLPIAAGCELGVEHFGGAYGWPVYEERGQENLVG